MKETFNQIPWTREQTEGLENSILSHYVYAGCFGGEVSVLLIVSDVRMVYVLIVYLRYNYAEWFLS